MAFYHIFVHTLMLQVEAGSRCKHCHIFLDDTFMLQVDLGGLNCFPFSIECMEAGSCCIL